MKKSILSLASLAARVLPMSVKQGIYRLPWLSGIVRRGLNRAAPHGMTQVIVAGGALAGCRLALDMQSEKDYWLGTYEPQLQSTLREYVNPGMTVYDIGANIGYITILLAKIVSENGQVYAFEALPQNVERLQHNLALNELGDRVKVVSAAVVDRSGPVTFLVGPSGGMGKTERSAGRTNFEYSDAIQVEGCALDDFVYQQGNAAPEAVKLDIEGGEVLALPGMRKLLAEKRPIVLLELHGPEAARSAWDAFQSAEYRLCSLGAGYPQVASFEALDWKAYLIAFPEGDRDSARN